MQIPSVRRVGVAVFQILIHKLQICIDNNLIVFSYLDFVF